MTTKLFNELDEKHRTMVLRNDHNLLTNEDIGAYIKEVRAAGASIADPQERDSLRAYLRYWAGIVYRNAEYWPDTELMPIDHGHKKAHNRGKAVGEFLNFVSYAIIAGILGGITYRIALVDVPIALGTIMFVVVLYVLLTGD